MYLWCLAQQQQLSWVSCAVTCLQSRLYWGRAPHVHDYVKSQHKQVTFETADSRSSVATDWSLSASRAVSMGTVTDVFKRLSNTMSHSTRLKSWLVSLTKPVQHMVLYRKKLNMFAPKWLQIKPADKENLTYRCANFHNFRSIISLRMWFCCTGWTFRPIKLQPLRFPKCWELNTD